MLDAALSGHGTFFYNAQQTLDRYGNKPDQLALAMKSMGMSHGWVRLHSWNKNNNTPTTEPHGPTKRLIEGLQDAGISVAGWGWNQGVSPISDATVAAAQLKRYGLKHYVADIEHEHSGAQWSNAKIRTYFKTLRSKTAVDTQILLSTFAFIGSHAPQMMQTAEPFVNGFAPQVYWFFHPKSWMNGRSDLPPGSHYKLNNAPEYARLCVDMWRHYVSKPLVITGQSYWHKPESAAFTKGISEGKLKSFVVRFDGWNQIAGLNWWHFGHKHTTPTSGAMSTTMMTSIRAAHLDTKPFDN